MRRRDKDGRLTDHGREQLRRELQRHLAQALAATYDERGDLSMTLLETGLALVAVAELDEDGGRAAHDRVQEYLARIRTKAA